MAMHNVMVKREGTNYFQESIFPPFRVEFSRDEINIVVSAKERKQTERAQNLRLGYDRHYFWYLDYRQLTALLKHHWDSYFQMAFSESSRVKSDIFHRLSRIEPIRNAIAHHRYVTERDLHELQALEDQLNSNLKNEYIRNFDDLALNPKEGLMEHIGGLVTGIQHNLETFTCVPAEKVHAFKNAVSLYLPMVEQTQFAEQVDEFCNLLWEYNQMPRKHGSAQIVSRFIKERGLLDKATFFIELLEENK